MCRAAPPLPAPLSSSARRSRDSPWGWPASARSRCSAEPWAAGRQRDAAGLPSSACGQHRARYQVRASAAPQLPWRLRGWDPSPAARLLSRRGPLLPHGHAPRPRHGRVLPSSQVKCSHHVRAVDNTETDRRTVAPQNGLHSEIAEIIAASCLSPSPETLNQGRRQELGSRWLCETLPCLEPRGFPAAGAELRPDLVSPRGWGAAPTPGALCFPCPVTWLLWPRVVDVAAWPGPSDTPSAAGGGETSPWSMLLVSPPSVTALIRLPVQYLFSTVQVPGTKLLLVFAIEFQNNARGKPPSVCGSGVPDTAQMPSQRPRPSQASLH